MEEFITLEEIIRGKTEITPIEFLDEHVLDWWIWEGLEE